MMNSSVGKAIASGKKHRAPRPPKCDGHLYTVRPTDTLSLIAHRFGLTVEQILAVNPQIKDPNAIFVGQVICIPKRVPKPRPDEKPLG